MINSKVVEQDKNNFFQESRVVYTLVRLPGGTVVERFYTNNVPFREVVRKDGKIVEERELEGGEVARVKIYSEGCEPLVVENI